MKVNESKLYLGTIVSSSTRGSTGTSRSYSTRGTTFPWESSVTLNGWDGKFSHKMETMETRTASGVKLMMEGCGGGEVAS